jgi:hypothetical protein
MPRGLGISLIAFAVLVSQLGSAAASQGACAASLREKGVCTRDDLTSAVGCSVCASKIAECDAIDVVQICRELVATAPDPQDPPFDLTKALFSGTFSSHGVLQRAPRQSSVYGTAKPGATVVVQLNGPNSYVYSSPASPVANLPSDRSVHGTWRVILPPQPAGFGYSLTVTCTGCANATAASITDIGFGGE